MSKELPSEEIPGMEHVVRFKESGLMTVIRRGRKQFRRLPREERRLPGLRANIFALNDIQGTIAQARRGGPGRDGMRLYGNP